MGLFKKKNDADKSAATPENGAESKAAASKKNKKNELLRCLDESVWESVYADLKANKKFIITDDDGNKRYVALLFDTKSVGGLVGKEAKRDESKGSALEAIRTSRIKSYIRNEMLLDDSFVIIPDANTLDSMDEFMFFNDAKFILCTIDSEGNIRTETQRGTDEDDDPEIELTFDQVKQMATDDVDTVDEWFLSQKTAKEAAKATAEAGANDEVAPVDVKSEDFEEDIPELDEDDDFSDIGTSSPATGTQSAAPVASTASADDALEMPDGPVAQTQAQPQPQPQPQAQPVGDSYPEMSGDSYGDGGYGDSYDDTDDGGYDEYADITAEDLDNFVVRHFYSSDLGLEVSTAAFDAQFVHNNQYVPFNENRGTGWLNEYLNNMSKDANTRMLRLRQENMYSLRSQFMSAIQDACVKIEQSLSTEDDGTQFGKMKYAIERSRTMNLENIDQSTQQKKEQLEDSWNRKLQQVGAEASAAAIQQYIDRYGKGHDSDIFNLESREKDEIERDYQNAMRRLHEDRRIEASKMLDAAINASLSALSKVYLGMLQSEKVEYMRLQNEITRFIDENRKDEKARIEALAENNRQVKQANDVRKEYAAKMKAMASEFDMKKVALEADISAMQRKHDEDIRKSDNEWKAKLAEYQAKIDSLQEELKQSKEDFHNLHDTLEADYGKQIDDLKNELDLREDNMGHVIETHKRSNLITVFLIIAAVIAAIGAGFILGTWINVSKVSRLEQENAYYRTYQNNGVPVEDITDESATGTDADASKNTNTTVESEDGSVIVNIEDSTTETETDSTSESSN